MAGPDSCITDEMGALAGTTMSAPIDPSDIGVIAVHSLKVPLRP